MKMELDPTKIPLTPADLKSIDVALFQLNQMNIALDRAEAVGLDVSQERQARDTLYNFMMGVKAVYFPGR